uniref:WH2 domain-containing protein n=1 Tax=Rhabditophanes sp. KR3021 TaxID=114890 RepID=A0AC35UEI7_9BILA
MPQLEKAYYIIDSVRTYKNFAEDSSDDDFIGEQFFRRLRGEPDLPKTVPAIRQPPSAAITKDGFKIPSITAIAAPKKVLSAQNEGPVLKPAKRLSQQLSALSISGVTKSEGGKKIELPSRRSVQIGSAPMPQQPSTTTLAAPPKMHTRQHRSMIVGSSASSIGKTAAPAGGLFGMMAGQPKPVMPAEEVTRGRRTSARLAAPPVLSSATLSRSLRSNSVARTPVPVAIPTVLPPPKLPSFGGRQGARARSEPPKPDRSSKTSYNLRETIKKPDFFVVPVPVSRTSSVRRSVSRETPRLPAKRSNSVAPPASTTTPMRPRIGAAPLATAARITAPPSNLRPIGHVTKEKIDLMVARLSQPKRRQSTQIS